MKIYKKNLTAITIISVISLLLGLSGTNATYAASPAGVVLGAAGNFAILSKAGISTTGNTLIVGDIGVSPVAATYITGFGLVLPADGAFSTSVKVTGKVYAPDYANPTAVRLSRAVLDMQKAYTDAAGRPPDATELGAGDIGGLTISPGVYKWSTGLTIPKDVTLSGGANDVWIFQIAGTLTVSSATKVLLSGGAQASNIFWVVAGKTTIGTTAIFNGNILDQTAIVLNTGAVLNGRALAGTAVTLDSNSITMPSVVVVAPPPTPIPPLTGISALTSAVISWTTDTLSDSQVEYGTTTKYELLSPLQDVSVPVTSHSVTLSSLAPSTTYHYRVKSRDVAGNLTVSSDYILITPTSPISPPSAPTTPAPTTPQVSAISVNDITDTSAKVSWVTDKLINSQVEYGLTTNYGSYPSWQGASVPVVTHSFLLSSLSPDTTYHYRIQSKDAPNNEVVSSPDYTFTTSPTVPSLPSTGASPFSFTGLLIVVGILVVAFIIFIIVKKK